jgi:hypothetical protein
MVSRRIEGTDYSRNYEPRKFATELEEVLSNDGHAQLEIYEAEEADTVTASGDADDHA